MSICGTARSVSLRELPTELIQFILKHFAIQDLKKCHSINNIWGDEVIQEIRRRLEFGSRYPTVKELAIGTPNADKKVMIRGWIKREKVAVTLPNIFDGLKPPSYLGIDTKTFVVVDKPEYDLTLNIETDSEYSSSGSKTESEDEDIYSNNVSPPIIMGTAE
ncbi:hypothetical protein GLOIN_2v1763149 [Rhizophagus irregularis DAOM 181602=DAOM 197198]|uniref:F-box domain-containing protein n=1 Tax=Rhizophagus irregularis (strain DAOM 181602 / DAOM 197198 / MUCL 43194) TaxID=747089 RepID=A0A2P4QVA4_RHIID|nr:hypothetical protein GLOIN_2v1763149 [Rhizophagus irregularis DAOM 181602=DAOM 197198]POG81576.1 hypothetical protein GLOIN_2v1763149 [Rhizophagus irregularis DAOM 181602=DAOM 197198]|eukprot:XP_025188442.1 hypothetical protein GLOIN_2v1763149 [Rhizophagus irregularis DAOM 181602=DAOM 197198]